MADEILYRHERLARGALNTPETVHLHFALGSNRKMQRRLCEKLVSLGATPKESFIVEPKPAALVSFPVTSAPEVAGFGRHALRFADDHRAQPCSVQLERVIAYLGPDGKPQLSPSTDISAWLALAAGYIPTYPGTTDIHHSIRVPKKGKASLSLDKLTDLVEPLNFGEWSLFMKPDAWCFRSAREIKPNGNLAALLERERAKLASLLREVAPNAEISITVEQVLACWEFPFQPAEDNRSRVSFSQMMGTPEDQLLNLGQIFDECQPIAPGTKLLVREEGRQESIITNLEPFRLAALAQDFDPIIMAIAVIPATAELRGPRFADQFCSQVVAYGESPDDAERLIGAYGDALWLLVQSGSGPIAGYQDMYENVFYWSAVAAGAKTPAKRGRSSERILAAGEQMFSVTASALNRHRRFDEVIRKLTEGRTETHSRLAASRFVMIPFRSATRSSGDHLRGSLFAVLSSASDDRDRLENFVFRASELLHRAPIEVAEDTVPETAGEPDVREEIRIRQVLDHDRLWNAVDAVFGEASGTRLDQIAKLFPDVVALFDRYPRLCEIKKDIEETDKSTTLMEDAWNRMTKLHPKRVYYWRKRAGLPSRRK